MRAHANTSTSSQQVPHVPSVNFHLWKPCNMRCGFCFATFQDIRPEHLPKGHLPKEDAMLLVENLAEADYDKINFAGGEPTLCPWLPDLIEMAKRRGMTTSIVTNGSTITETYLDKVDRNLEWVGLSIDTLDEDTQKRMGRAVRGTHPMTQGKYLQLVNAIKRRGIRLKINTVVTSMNWGEDLTRFIRLAKPERWKVFQVLPVIGQNDDRIAEFVVSKPQFESYVMRCRSVEGNGLDVVPESNELMTASYVMISPDGRFYDNADGKHTYSTPILEVGVAEASKEMRIDVERFRKRGGQYAW